MTPPHRSTCSPKRADSTSSLNVDLNTPGFVAPRAFASARMLLHASPVKSWCTAMRAGTPNPRSYSCLTMKPGPLGAIIETSTFWGGVILVRVRLRGVRDEHEDDVCLLHRAADLEERLAFLPAVLERLLPETTPFPQSEEGGDA